LALPVVECIHASSCLLSNLSTYSHSAPTTYRWSSTFPLMGHRVYSRLVHRLARLGSKLLLYKKTPAYPWGWDGTLFVDSFSLSDVSTATHMGSSHCLYSRLFIERSNDPPLSVLSCLPGMLSICWLVGHVKPGLGFHLLLGIKVSTEMPWNLTDVRKFCHTLLGAMRGCWFICHCFFIYILF
jgi:hypothetical protein